MTDADPGDAANEEITPAMRLVVLQGKHRALDEKIRSLQAQPYHNQLLIQRLKKEKLRLKDLVERLKDELVPDLNA
ncbi:MAG: YdcH family protein [Cellvibrionales bacterium]|jgi:hypothetical protein